MRIAVLGGGNGSFAAAADFALAGHETRLWRHDVDAVTEHPGERRSAGALRSLGHSQGRHAAGDAARDRRARRRTRPLGEALGYGPPHFPLGDRGPHAQTRRKQYRNGRSFIGLLGWGVDILYYASRYLTKALDSPRYTAPDIIERNMRDGKIGLTTGKGFLDYEGLDLEAYRAERLKAFVGMLRFMGLARPPVLPD